MILTSEWVSLGHPDKMADFISCFILDRYLERDPETRFALEVKLADAVIRIMDYAHARSLDIAGAIIAKMGYNQTRPMRHGGKQF